MKALVGAFNQEKALVGAFSVIVQPVVEPMDHYTALIPTLCSRLHPVPPDRGAPRRCGGGQERAGDPGVQGRRGPGAQRRVVQGREEGQHRPGRSSVSQVRLTTILA